MITAKGYSKDPGIPAEGIVITFGKDMMDSQGGMLTFLKSFIETMDGHEEGDYWMHKCTNLPKQDLDEIYIIIAGRLWAKVYCGGFKRDQPTIGYTADGKEIEINWNYIILSGPLEKCPFRRQLKGFQGARYCTKLF